MRRATRIRASVCANTTVDDIRAGVVGGADALGVVVQVRHRADDAVPLVVAADLLRHVPPYVGRYAVTHATELDELLQLRDLPVDAVQLHGPVEVGTAGALRARVPGWRLLKAIHVVDRVPDVGPWSGVVDALVLDSLDPVGDRIGGTGLTHDWSLSAAVVERAALPVVLAGGLRPGNVGRATAQVRPWGVNVNSGVEVGGRKSAELIHAFVERANERGAPAGPRRGVGGVGPG